MNSKALRRAAPKTFNIKKQNIYIMLIAMYISYTYIICIYIYLCCMFFLRIPFLTRFLLNSERANRTLSFWSWCRHWLLRVSTQTGKTQHANPNGKQCVWNKKQQPVTLIGLIIPKWFQGILMLFPKPSERSIYCPTSMIIQAAS